MITRIELSNFMSHRHTVIEPAAGLTVLVGPNNVGKSAIVAALQILCHNENSTYVMRHGERNCSVVVHTDDGHVVQWQRKKSPSYDIDGQTFDRLRGSKIPDELHRVLKLGRVDGASEQEFDIHFGPQKSPIFLLGGSDAAAARFFASSSDANRLVKMQKRHKEKHADAKREKACLEKESSQLNAELAALDPIVQLDERLEHEERNYTALQQGEIQLADAERHLMDLEFQTTAAAQYAAGAAALAPLEPPPVMSPTASLERLAWSLERETATLHVADSYASALADLGPPPRLHDTRTIGRVIDEMVTLVKVVQRGEGELESLAVLTEPPPLADARTMEWLIERLASVRRELAMAEGRVAILASLEPQPVFPSDRELVDVLSSLKETWRLLDRWQYELDAASPVEAPPVPIETEAIERSVVRLEAAGEDMRRNKKELLSAERELQAVAAELRAAAEGSLCPICGGELDPDRVVERAAAGLGGHGHE